MAQLNDVVRFALTGACKGRELYASAFQLDAVLGRIVLTASEPLLAQVRIAWWRDQFRDPEVGCQAKDPLVQSLRTAWGDDAVFLVPLIDGWESLLSEEETGSHFVEGRSKLAGAIACMLDCKTQRATAEALASLWAFSDLAHYFGKSEIRDWALTNWEESASNFGRSSIALRPLGVLGGLAKRALEKGGVPMLGDRMSPFVGFRLWAIGV